MRDVNRLLNDSQEFLQNVKAFQKKQDDLEKNYASRKHELRVEEQEKQNVTGAIRDFGGHPFGSSDSSTSLSVKENEVSLPPGPVKKPSKKDRKQVFGPLAPVGNESKYVAFPNYSFTPFARIEENFRADLLTYIETFYYQHKRLPFIRELDKRFLSHSNRPKVLDGWTKVVENISQSLSNRGIPPYEIQDSDYIDPKFAWAVTLVVNITDRRNLAAKLKEAGISSKEWNALLRKKSHSDYYKMRIDQIFSEDLQNEAKLAIAKSIQAGDLQAIKYYNEWMDIYRRESTTKEFTNNTEKETIYVSEPISQQMITTVLSAIMEILASYVSSEILINIATEIRKNETIKKAIEVRSTEPASNILR